MKCPHIRFIQIFHARFQVFNYVLFKLHENSFRKINFRCKAVDNVLTSHRNRQRFIVASQVIDFDVGCIHREDLNMNETKKMMKKTHTLNRKKAKQTRNKYV